MSLKKYFHGGGGKTVEEYSLTLMPNNVKRARSAMLISMENSLTGAVGHYVPSYEKNLRRGFNGIKAEIKEKMEKLELSIPEDFQRLRFYEAATICCEAIVSFAGRYSNLAKQPAEKTSDHGRKEELLQIAANCSRVPGNPAKTLRA